MMAAITIVGAIVALLLTGIVLAVASIVTTTIRLHRDSRKPDDPDYWADPDVRRPDDDQDYGL